MGAVEEVNFGLVCADAQRWLAATFTPQRKLGCAQFAAAPGVAWRCAVWGRGSFPDFGASAPALVQQPVTAEPLYGIAVELLTLALNDNIAIPFKADRGEVTELLFG